MRPFWLADGCFEGRFCFGTSGRDVIVLGGIVVMREEGSTTASSQLPEHHNKSCFMPGLLHQHTSLLSTNNPSTKVVTVD